MIYDRDSIYRLSGERMDFFFYISFFGGLRWIFVAACRLPLVVASGGYSLLRCMGSHCSGFSCCGARALGTWASVVAARGLSSCSVRA